VRPSENNQKLLRTGLVLGFCGKGGFKVAGPILNGVVLVMLLVFGGAESADAGYGRARDKNAAGYGEAGDKDAAVTNPMNDDPAPRMC
jgi:hypothetical protein